MSIGTNPTPTSAFDFSLEEQWAVHAAILAYIERSAGDGSELAEHAVEVAILEKIEAGEFEFTAFELDRIRYECAYHADSEMAPLIDREPAMAVVEKIDRRCNADVGR